MPRLLTLAAIVLTVSVTCASAQVSFSKDIQPIFEASCWKCHGAAVQLSKLDLRTRQGALTGGVHGPSLTPGNAQTSRMFRMVSGQEKPAMPMDGKLDAAAVDKLRRWIEEGAVWDGTAPPVTSKAAPSTELEKGELAPGARDYWAFRTPVRTAVAQGAKHPVDAFLLQTLKARELTPAPRADATTLVRRAYLDLIGLPPAPAEVAAFVNDKSADAWEKLIDRLLESPHYGERWGRHWLDVARYADSNGYEHDFDRPNAWRYRDYVIRSFNADKPWNVFLREQLAGDELPEPSHDALIATGFLRNHAKVGYREKDNPEFRYEYLDDMIATVGRGILGMTVQCARCHNHKFDPILQRDYYKLQATLFGVVEVDHPLTTPDKAAEYEQKLASVTARATELRRAIRTMEEPYRSVLLAEKFKKLPANIQAAINTPEKDRTPGQTLLANQVIRTTSVSPDAIDRIMKPEDLSRKRELAVQIAAVEKERPAPIPLAMGITDGDYRFTPDGAGDEPAPGKGIKAAAIEGSYVHKGPGAYKAPPSYFLIRGDVNSPGSLMQPGFPTVATYGNPPVEIPAASGKTSGRRLALAEWLTSADNPLTARVVVNRIWHHHFGRGIVASIDNFGKMGDLPTHPELLDWLALEFQQQGWSVKQMHRLLMTSEAYRMSSAWISDANMRSDAQNTWMWRFRSRRVEAEVVRDSILAVSGGLNRTVGGQPVFPPLQREILAQEQHGIWRKQADGPETWRRSVYIYRKRGLPFPMLDTFDLPDQNISCGARGVSTVPSQALMLMNDDFVIRQSELFSQRVLEAEPTSVDRQIAHAYRLALGRNPDARESELAREHVRERGLKGFAHVLLNLNEFAYLR
ncbi:MAG: PSD1 and planctomycete cytochrome C domain-containing protein [Bryobacteraceae bacterium]|nr:PSD1 and planctomycete cytochrome C domain-containing protein [Bryobacteraceae bacterium]